MDDFTKQKIGFVVGLLAVLFTAREGIGEPLLQQLHYSIFGWSFSLNSLINILNLLLAIAAYSYAWQFISTRQGRFTGVAGFIGSAAYLLAMFAPLIYGASFLAFLTAQYISETFTPYLHSLSTQPDLLTTIGSIAFILGSIIFSYFFFPAYIRFLVRFTNKDHNSRILQERTEVTELLAKAGGILEEGNLDGALKKIVDIISRKSLSYLGKPPDKTLMFTYSLLHWWLSGWFMRWLYPPILVQWLDEYIPTKRPDASAAYQNIINLYNSTQSGTTLNKEDVASALEQAKSIVSIALRPLTDF